MIYVCLVAAAAVCAVQAMRASRLLVSALWLAGVSALVALTLYRMGAPQVAVIELSVGAGLVTVLFVFAISIAGEDAMQAPSLVPQPVAWVLALLAIVLIGGLALPAVSTASALPIPELPFAQVLWEQRELDVLVQIALIFAGVMGVLGLLSGAVDPSPRGKADQRVSSWEQDTELAEPPAVLDTEPDAEPESEKELA